MKLASRTEVLTDSLPLKISAKAKAMMANGENVVNLSVGEPDFPSPKNIKATGIYAINNNITRYTASAGIPELRKAVAANLKKTNNLDYDFTQIIVTNGAKQAIASTLLALVNPGDEVIYPVPCYASYVDLIRLAGGVPVPCLTTAETGFRMVPEELEQLITDKTVAVIINNPNNPTGAAFTPEEVQALGEMLVKKDIWVISDEIYEKLRYDGNSHLSFASIDGLKEKVALINGVSKYYCMTGWRIGFLAAEPKLASAVGKIQSQMTGSPCSISQKAAVEAYAGDCSEPEAMVGVFKARSELIAGLLDEIPDLKTMKPEGAFYAWVDVTSYLGKSSSGATASRGKIINDSFALCEYLLEEYKVALIPGVAFGMEGYVRFSFAASEDNIAEGVKRFGDGLGSLV